MSDTRIKQHPVLGIPVSTDGHVMVPATKFSRANWTLGSIHPNGYASVTVNRSQYLVHRLVAETFIENPDSLPDVDHLNRDRSDNRLENLRWCTRSVNQRNTRANDRCRERLGVNYFENHREANRINCALWYSEHRDEFNTRRREMRKREKTC